MSHHISRTTATLSTAVVAAALVAAGLSTGAVAQPAPEPSPGAAPMELSGSQRAELLREADQGAAGTAAELGLGKREKLVVRDVVKDRDGTTHTRYE
ncbi:peptidase M4 family protein, partial [Streptomyces sp. E11-3]